MDNNRDNSSVPDVDINKFVSLVTHEIRGPASIIRGYLDLYQQLWGKSLEARQKTYLKKISAANDRLIELSDSLLPIFQADFGKVAIDPEPADVTKLGDDALMQWEPQIAAKKLRVEKEYDERLPAVSIDITLTNLAFSTLLSNAVKYTPKGGRIKLEIRKRATEIVISVSDTGLGIPSDQQDKIFSNFFRASNIRRESGIGTGLHILQAMLKRAGGKIWFESEENKGSTFFVAIPLSGMRKVGNG